MHTQERPGPETRTLRPDGGPGMRGVCCPRAEVQAGCCLPWHRPETSHWRPHTWLPKSPPPATRPLHRHPFAVGSGNSCRTSSWVRGGPWPQPDTRIFSITLPKTDGSGPHIKGHTGDKRDGKSDPGSAPSDKRTRTKPQAPLCEHDGLGKHGPSVHSFTAVGAASAGRPW